jgi:hypothetical protein
MRLPKSMADKGGYLLAVPTNEIYARVIMT